MICPFCGSENLDGTDDCANCSQDLTSLDRHRGDTRLEKALMGQSLEALRPKPAVIVSPQTSVAKAIAAMCEHNIGCVLVGSLERVEGIFSERDVLLKVAHAGQGLEARPVSELMTPDPEMLDLSTPIAFALNRMSVGDFRHLPITEGGKLRGIISLRDFLAFLNRRYPDLIVAEPDGA